MINVLKINCGLLPVSFIHLFYSQMALHSSSQFDDVLHISALNSISRSTVMAEIMEVGA